MIIGEQDAPPSAPSHQQREVMAHALDAPALVDAGAGTGKTFTIVERVAQLASDPARGCPASSILLLTFSKKAAAELRGRIIRRLGPGVAPPECATFHAFALSLLKEHGFELTLSPDSMLINEADARVEFWHAFDELLRGALGGAAEAFPLRFGVVETVRARLFDICQRLRDSGVSVQEFQGRAIEALEIFAALPDRALFDETSKTPYVPVLQISDDDFHREMREERQRVESAAALFARYDERLRSRAALTYSDLLQAAIAMATSHPEAVHALRGRFRHCIVDEYQDTDPLQIRLLETLFGEACDRVMVVGDPRQTIYGFRGIDPANLARFADKPSCVRYALRENRRSRQEILDLAHSVIAPQSGDTDPLEATRDAAQEPVVHAKSRWTAPGEPPPNRARGRELEARWVAAKIVELLRSGRRVESPDSPGTFEPIAPKHIAILNRRKTQLQPLIAALNERNVPFRQYGGAGFYEAPEILDSLAWLRIVTEPLDDAAVARVLSSPSVGLSDAGVAALCREMREDESHLSRRALVEELPLDLDPDVRARLERFRRIVDSLDRYAGAPLVTAWEALLDRAGLLLAADVRSSHRHEQAGANLDKLSAMVRGFADRNPGARAFDFDRYVRELSLIEADDQEADPPSADAVSVMTIHASKGLEWPIVFVIDVWPPLPTAYTPVRLDPPTGALLVSEGPDGLKPFHTAWVEMRDRAAPDDVPNPEREREERRLFYVAITRARDELYVSGYRSPPAAKHRDGKVHDYLASAITWIAFRGWPTLDEAALAAGPYEPPGHGRAQSPLPLSDYVAERIIRPAIELPALSFSSVSRFVACPRSVTYRLALGLPGLGGALHDDADDDAAVERTPAQPVPESLLAAGPFGELVHVALEFWARSPGNGARAYVAGAIRALTTEVSAADERRAIADVAAVISALEDWTPLKAESPFTMDVGGVSITGYIDLLARDSTGAVAIVDYKTGVAGAEHYALQLALYTIAARAVYGLEPSRAVIARVAAGVCRLEEVPAMDEAEVTARITAVADGIKSADMTARPGPQCAACPYRAAPCTAYTV